MSETPELPEHGATGPVETPEAAPAYQPDEALLVETLKGSGTPLETSGPDVLRGVPTQPAAPDQD